MVTKKIQIIIGSTRPNRIGNQVAEWLRSEFGNKDGIEIEIIDLLEVNLPFLDEPKHPAMNQYTKPYTKAWSEKIKEGSGYIWLSSEYNSGYPAPLKNAIDYLYHEWANKPVLIASYGVAGGPTANHQLVEVATRLKMQIVEPVITMPIKPEWRKEDETLKDPSTDLVIYHEDVQKSLNALIALINK